MLLLVKVFLVFYYVSAKEINTGTLLTVLLILRHVPSNNSGYYNYQLECIFTTFGILFALSEMFLILVEIKKLYLPTYTVNYTSIPAYYKVSMTKLIY